MNQQYLTKRTNPFFRSSELNSNLIIVFKTILTILSITFLRFISLLFLIVELPSRLQIIWLGSNSLIWINIIVRIILNIGLTLSLVFICAIYQILLMEYVFAMVTYTKLVQLILIFIKLLPFHNHIHLFKIQWNSLIHIGFSFFQDFIELVHLPISYIFYVLR